MSQKSADRGSTRSRRDVDRVIAERGLRVEQIGDGVWRIVGPGTDILHADWRAMTTLDLVPVKS